MPQSSLIIPPLASALIIGWTIIVAADLRDADPIQPHGGATFPERMELPVEMMAQDDGRWASDPLGHTSGTIASEGCAIASAAMALKFHGAPTDPGALNRALTATPGGFTTNGWLYWEKAAAVARAPVVHAYEGSPRYRLIDRNLARSNPVIARIRMPSATTHFVVICGKEENRYLIRDPGGRRAYHLSDLQGPLEAIRYYLPN